MPRSKANENIQNSIEELAEKIHILKEAVITQINIIDISDLNKKLNVLKEIVESQKNEMGVLKGQINDLKETIVNQNKVIVGLVSEVKTTLKCYVTPGHSSTKYSNLFPVLSEGKLKEIEDEIDDETNFAMVSTKFLNNLRIAFRLNKNRYYKKKCLKRKAGIGNTFLNSEEDSDSENVDPGIAE
ncbi:uncharacterized protein LOC124419207 [Lucilia cuprina]|uniref:uncharacterized protein LOC124419207 n=1 Tax=Lucilia cuprina TaxID=7375 RepID=UPI001F05D846|nr:uncharacterized protein LOC124419207 [Lucilia cuprina]